MEKSSQKASFGQGLELADIVIKAIASAAKKTGASSEDVQAVIGKPGVIYKYFEDLLVSGVEPEPKILKLISAGEKIMIEALDGKGIIGQARNTFKSSIDRDFKNWGLNKVDSASPETLLNVYEIANDDTFTKMFSEINPDLEKLVMTQSQIILFCEKHPTWLRQDGYATLFLTKVNGEYFVVYVLVYSDGLSVGVNRLEYDLVWSAGSCSRCNRVVAPQLES